MTTVLVVGPADPGTVEQVAGWVHALVSTGVTKLVIDVTAAHDVDRRLLTLLARTRAVLGARGGTLQVTAMALPQFLTALHDASLDEVFVVYDALAPRPAASPARCRSAARLDAVSHRQRPGLDRFESTLRNAGGFAASPFPRGSGSSILET